VAALTGIDGVTVVIPSIPIRQAWLQRALDSVAAQTLSEFMDVNTVVSVDRERGGAAKCRQRGLSEVETEWVAFLDDDDEFMPGHLELLLANALAFKADFVYSWFMIKDAAGREQPTWDPFPANFGKPWDLKNPVQTTITTLVRTELAQSVGFDTVPDGETGADGHRRGEDFRFTLGCQAAGGKISHLPERTWWWHHHGNNTSGIPDRW
jgi:hypothetical protein